MKRVIKNVNFVNDASYFTVLFGKWALQAWRANSLPINCSPHSRGILPLRIASKWANDALNLIDFFVLLLPSPILKTLLNFDDFRLIALVKFCGRWSCIWSSAATFWFPLFLFQINYIINKLKSQYRKI